MKVRLFMFQCFNRINISTKNEYHQVWYNHYEKLENSKEKSQGREDEVNVSTNSNAVNMDMLDLEIAESEMKKKYIDHKVLTKSQ